MEGNHQIWNKEYWNLQEKGPSCEWIQVINIRANFSVEGLKTRSWSHVIQVLEDHRCQYRVFYPENLFMIIDREGEIFHDESSLKEFITSKISLEGMLERMSNNNSEH